MLGFTSKIKEDIDSDNRGMGGLGGSFYDCIRFGIYDEFGICIL